jgi:hypothetical protein
MAALIEEPVSSAVNHECLKCERECKGEYFSIEANGHIAHYCDMECLQEELAQFEEDEMDFHSFQVRMCVAELK